MSSVNDVFTIFFFFFTDNQPNKMNQFRAEFSTLSERHRHSTKIQTKINRRKKNKTPTEKKNHLIILHLTL